MPITKKEVQFLLWLEEKYLVLNFFLFLEHGLSGLRSIMQLCFSWNIVSTVKVIRPRISQWKIYSGYLPGKKLRNRLNIYECYIEVIKIAPSQIVVSMYYFWLRRQGLNDLANFIEAMTEKHNFTGPWIAYGGSYPGSMAAWLRLKFPHLISGSVSSSGPLEAKVSNYYSNCRNIWIV